MIQGKVLDVENFSKRKIELKYPNVVVPILNQTTPLVVSNLEKGEMPVVGIYKGDKRVICYVSESVYNIDKLLRTHDQVIYCKTENESVELTGVEDYLEVVEWTY